MDKIIYKLKRERLYKEISYARLPVIWKLAKNIFFIQTKKYGKILKYWNTEAYAMNLVQYFYIIVQAVLAF